MENDQNEEEEVDDEQDDVSKPKKQSKSSEYRKKLRAIYDKASRHPGDGLFKIGKIDGSLYVPVTIEEEMKRWGFAQELIAAKNTLACPSQQVLHSECILGHLKALTREVIKGHLDTWLTNHVFPKYMAALEDKDLPENLELL